MKQQQNAAFEAANAKLKALTDQRSPALADLMRRASAAVRPAAALAPAASPAAPLPEQQQPAGRCACPCDAPPWGATPQRPARSVGIKVGWCCSDL